MAITITWTDTNTFETEYVVQRSVDAGPWVTIATLPPDTEIYVDNDTASGSTYDYTVQAICPAECGTADAVASNQVVQIQRPMILEVLIASDSESFEIPLPEVDWDTGLYAFNYNFVVNWGDGSEDTITSWNQIELTHIYTTAGFYDITITGLCESWAIDYSNIRLKIRKIKQWGNLGIKDFTWGFIGCWYMRIEAADAPNLSDCTTLYYMFADCQIASGEGYDTLATWDTSNIQNMSHMFENNAMFNDDLSGWDVSNVTDMSYMFLEAEWAIRDNNSLANWDVSSVENFAGMFKWTRFNGDITLWQPSSATDMSSMFYDAWMFNQDISGWNVSNVTNFSNMFFGATSFNQSLNGWTLSSSPISMYRMFAYNEMFNGNISLWDVSSVTIMSGMFDDARHFDQDLSGWDISNVTTMLNMFRDSGFSTTNYDLLLNAWALLTPQSGVTMSIVPAAYHVSSQAARDILDINYGWTITDYGPIPTP